MKAGSATAETMLRQEKVPAMEKVMLACRSDSARTLVAMELGSNSGCLGCRWEGIGS